MWFHSVYQSFKHEILNSLDLCGEIIKTDLLFWDIS